MNPEDLFIDLADAVSGHEFSQVCGALTILLIDITQVAGWTKEEFIEKMELSWNSMASELELEGHDIH